MSDHTPVNVFEDSNEESVVPHISFDSIRDSIRTQTADSQVPSIWNSHECANDVLCWTVLSSAHGEMLKSCKL